MDVPADLFTNPELFPERMALPEGKLHFCHMSAESYLESPFLDHRTVKHKPGQAIFEIQQLLAAAPQTMPDVTHFVFHNAFCCSTLFSRHLDAAVDALVLREPNVLLEAASVYRYRTTPLLKHVSQNTANNLFRLITTLMARRYSHQQHVIIKPSDGCNNIMDKLLDLNSGNKCILMYSELERFLVAVLKYTHRADFVKMRVNELLIDEMNAEGKLPVNPGQLTIVQLSVLVWILHRKRMRSLMNRLDSERMRTINSEKFIASQDRYVKEALRFFGTKASDWSIDKQIVGTQSMHSKAHTETYSADQREQDFRKLREQLSDEIESGIHWAAQTFGMEMLNDLGNPLINE